MLVEKVLDKVKGMDNVILSGAKLTTNTKEPGMGLICNPFITNKGV